MYVLVLFSLPTLDSVQVLRGTQCTSEELKQPLRPLRALLPELSGQGRIALSLHAGQTAAMIVGGKVPKQVTGPFLLPPGSC